MRSAYSVIVMLYNNVKYSSCMFLVSYGDILVIVTLFDGILVHRIVCFVLYSLYSCVCTWIIEITCLYQHLL